MKKIALIALFAVSAAAVVQADPVKKEIKCPVMPTHKVKIADATKSKMFADYKGRRYFFCCAGCPGAFKANPAKFAKSESIPTPKKKK